MFENIGSALSSIWSNKLRSLLTLLGVVIGVSSVATLVALGQGLKAQTSTLIEGLGTNVLVVLPGKISTGTGGSQQVNPANFISGDILTTDDVQTITEQQDVTTVSPVSLVTGDLGYQDKIASPVIFAAYPNVLDALGLLKLGEGAMFKNRTGKEIVLSETAKESLFGSAEAIGQTVTLGNESFTVVGVLAAVKQGAFSSEYQDVSLIPFDESFPLNKDRISINRILVKASDIANVNSVRDHIKAAVLKNHKGQENFTVFTQQDVLDLFSTFLNLATALVSAIAAISLVVGGIGIMNIMLVTVTERTREIGLRKAVGATQGAILTQFLTEAVVVTLLGGLIGLLISFGVGKIVSIKTQLTPEFTWPVILLALGISTLIGVLFGLWPALRAARKDPIEALRYE